MKMNHYLGHLLTRSNANRLGKVNVDIKRHRVYRHKFVVTSNHGD